MIETADSRFASLGLPANQMATASLAPQFWPGIITLPISPTATGTPVNAGVYGGRWLVLCPTDSSAQYASKIDLRFFCGECANIANAGAWLPVAWLDNQTVADIETLLTARTDLRTQNWVPGEPVRQLIAENDQNNVTVGADVRARYPS